MDTGSEPFPNLWIDRLLAGVLINRFEGLLAKLFIGVGTSREPYDWETRRERLFQREIVERWKQFAVCQVAGGPKYDHDTRFRAVFNAYTFS